VHFGLFECWSARGFAEVAQKLRKMLICWLEPWACGIFSCSEAVKSKTLTTSQLCYTADTIQLLQPEWAVQ